MALFQGGDGPALKQLKVDRARSKVFALEPDYVLNVADQALADAYVAELHVEVPIVHFDQAELDSVSTQVNVRDYGDWKTVDGTVSKFDVPFTGDKEIFFMRPGPYDTMPPNANVFDTKLWFEVQGPNITDEQLIKLFTNWRKSIETYLSWHRDLWKDLDDQVRNATLRAFADRRQAIQNTQSASSRAAEKLGIKLRAREGDPQSFSAPAVRQKVSPQLPTAKASVSDPTLDRTIYDSIVTVLRGVGRSIERSASAIRSHDEEVLRDILLIPLNSHFENQAQGEAFNKAGKTDISIRHDGANLFIAECKIWRGQKQLIEAFDQLFSYLTWRDTKAAVIVFSRNASFNGVLSTMVSAAKGHPCFAGTFKSLDESTWEFEFHHPDDNTRRILVTLMAFDMGSDG